MKQSKSIAYVACAGALILLVGFHFSAQGDERSSYPSLFGESNAVGIGEEQEFTGDSRTETYIIFEDGTVILLDSNLMDENILDGEDGILRGGPENGAEVPPDTAYNPSILNDTLENEEGLDSLFEGTISDPTRGGMPDTGAVSPEMGGAWGVDPSGNPCRCP